ncbi:unnamed protein product [Lactuca virosa]|uniref:Secreted protein n=1 Tax=Lactuca virosa TaxID=75947 RepID=A0AAU9NU92_9ASTR|nr:unnamed protein product [Lactuca virosa]
MFITTTIQATASTLSITLLLLLFVFPHRSLHQQPQQHKHDLLLSYLRWRCFRGYDTRVDYKDSSCVVLQQRKPRLIQRHRQIHYPVIFLGTP